ncbi:MAG: PadR family transcriptional regulator [Vicinamibacterales bacterium]
MPDVILGEFEQTVLLAVLHAGTSAYGIPVWREIESRAERKASLAAVYKTLDRLEQKGYVRSRVGEPSAERGGRARRVYAVSAAGMRALRGSLGALQRMTRGLEDLLSPS